MRQYIQVLIVCILFVSSCSIDTEKQAKLIQPVPSPFTVVKEDMEDGNKSELKKLWIEEMHNAAPGVDWRAIEADNALKVYHHKQELNHREGIETIIDGVLKGEWIERGSRNQSGSVFDTEYDNDFHELYLISAGGTLWKGGLSGFTWSVVNQDLRFNPGLLRMIRYGEEDKRLIACIAHEPYYSDDFGQTWEAASTNFEASGGSNFKDALMLNGDNHEIYILARKNWGANIELLYSSDDGSSYTTIKTFNTSNFDNLTMANPYETNDIYIMEQTGLSTSRFYKIENGGSDLEVLNENSPLAFGSNGKGNLKGTTIGSIVRFYAYNGSDKLHISEDFGQNWLEKGTLPITPWGVRLFVSKSNPDLLLIGGVEAFRSIDGGSTWQKINGWGEYYGDVEYKLHADMMYFNEFTDIFGEPFILISNHGGLSKSYDGTYTNQSISLVGLNVSQYYSVRTYPGEDDFVFAGSQDQGFQRGLLPGSIAGIFDQVISGDYGHIIFTDKGKSLWTVYPGGWVSFYKNPKTETLAASWELNSIDESVWIPPLMSKQNAEGNVAYMAGGNISGSAGSFIIRMEVTQGSSGYEIVTDQLDFDFLGASGGKISAMAISEVNPNYWYVLTTNGKFYYSTDNGENFEKSITGPGSHYLYGSDILCSNIDLNTIYISGSGYSNAPVMVSNDGGISFKNLNIGMPPTMAFGLALNETEDLLFAATEAGPYALSIEEGTWYPMHGESAPNQAYWSVEYLNESKVVRLGTYGRGIWDFAIDESLSSTKGPLAHANIQLYPNPVSDELQLRGLEETIELVHFEIFNVRGNLIENSKLVQKSIPVSHLLSGTYMLRLNIGKEYKTFKFTKL